MQPDQPGRAFTLRLAVGAAVAGFGGLLTRGGAGSFKRDHYGHGAKRGGCGKGYRHKLLAESKQLAINYRPTAVYTREARKREYAGTVRMRVTFGADGAVKAVETLHGQPYGLTQSAERAAWSTNFTPALENGLPISVTRVLEYDFPSELTVDEQ